MLAQAVDSAKSIPVTVSDAARIAPIARTEIDSLAFEEWKRLLAFVETLDADDWSKPTMCTAWNVRVARMQEPIQALIGALLDDAAATRTLDVRTGLSFPLPALTISKILGLPRDAHKNFLYWFHKQDTVLGFNSRPTRQGFARAKTVIDYFKQLVAARRAEPQADLISDLVLAQRQGAPLSDAELVAALLLLVLAGFRTFERLLMNGIAQFTREPESYAALHAAPSKVSLVVDEILRDAQQVSFVRRRATTDILMAGTRIPRGARVELDVYAANHDPAIFDAPHQFQPYRRPNPHMTFGGGAHVCLGASLVRIETQMLLQQLMKHIPAFEPADALSRQALANGKLPADLRVCW